MAFRDLILKSFWLKGFSLVLATLIWFALSQSDLQTEVRPLNPFLGRTPERDLTRAVAVLKSAAEQRAFKVEPAQVTVKLSANGNILDQLNPEDVRVFVTLNGTRDHQGAMKVEVLVPSREIAVRSITPPIVDVRPIITNP